MKKPVATLMVLSIPIICLAAFNSTKWKFYKEISPVFGELAKFTIDDEIFAQAKKDLSDLRVVDDAGKETPFKIITGKSEQTRANYAVKIINSSYQLGRFSSAVLDLGDKGKIINNFILGTTGENFQRNVKIYGGDDMASWNVIADNAYIYDYTDKKGNFKAQNTRINFSDSVFRYYKVEISNEENNPVKITSAAASQIVSKGEREFARQPEFSVLENNELRATEILVDLGQSGMPNSKITFAADDKNFNRTLAIYSGNDRTNWTSRDQGYIFRYETPKFTGENLTVSYPETNDRYLKIQVTNKDNAPLHISGIAVYSIYREIIFPSVNGVRYRIYYGNDKAYYPEYDLEKYFQYLNTQSAVAAALSMQISNVEYEPEKAPEKPFSEKIPHLMTGAIIIVSSLLLVLIYKFMKK